MVDTKQASNYTQISTIRFSPSEPGTVKCKARNSLGNTQTNGLVQISDLPEPFTIFSLNNNEIADGDYVKLECGAIVYNYTHEISWLKDGEPVFDTDDKRITLSEQHTRFSWRKALIFQPINKNDEGFYKCEITDKNEEFHERDFPLKVHDVQAPVIMSNFNESVIVKPFGSSLTLECMFSGLPIASIQW